ncbi:hypothetical protein G9396_13125 [Providencia rettgeri]|nr:hypothetical protein G9396_13125 [Providencia rettgeri]
MIYPLYSGIFYPYWLEFLGWTVTEQSRGGYSGNLNPGERDLTISWGSTELSVIEAVICSKPLTQDTQKADLLSHFQKLLGYTHSRVMFHITYAYIEDKTGILEFLKTSAKEHSPDGFNFMSLEDIPHTDSRPPGFIASYRGDFEIFQVVFLILNMGQQRQKRAAKTAVATKRRKAPKKIGTNKNVQLMPLFFGISSDLPYINHVLAFEETGLVSGRAAPQLIERAYIRISHSRNNAAFTSISYKR